jgi:hypothetical protein
MAVTAGEELLAHTDSVGVDKKNDPAIGSFGLVKKN